MDLTFTAKHSARLDSWFIADQYGETHEGLFDTREEAEKFIADFMTPIVWAEADTDLAGKEWRCATYPEMRISQANPNGMFWVWATNYPNPIGRDADYDRAAVAAEKWARDHH